MVYQINCCICDKIYTGESYRPVWHRMKEHLQQSNIKDLVVRHFDQHHPQERINFKWQILHHQLQDVNRRKVMEAIYIRRANIEILMNGCVGRELPFEL